jgi:hypothetical protein
MCTLLRSAGARGASARNPPPRGPPRASSIQVSYVLAETSNTRGTSATGGVTLRRFFGIRLYLGYPLSSERDTLVDEVTNHPDGAARGGRQHADYTRAIYNSCDGYDYMTLRIA